MQIIIGAIAYEVIEVAELASEHGTLCGEISSTKCRIRIDADMAAPVKQVTLWHEIIHGILFNAGYREHDEQQIDALAYGLMQVLRDNPILRADSVQRVTRRPRSTEKQV